MSEHGVQGMLISKPENRRYFSGFSGSSGMLFISEHKSYLLTDFRYIEQAGAETEGYDIVRYTVSANELLSELAAKQDVRVIGFESDFVTYDVFAKLTECLPIPQFVPMQLDSLRRIKDSNEIALIKKAVEIADQAFSHILSFIRPGISEQAVALELEYHMGKLGAERPAFDTITASGKRGALPHGKASSKMIERGDFVTMDFGAVYQGYHSDITRTICVGTSTARQREIYDLVLTAQLAGVQAVQPGKTGKEIDSVARKIIADAGFGEYFGHGLGHGVGLNIHEDPRLSPNSGQMTVMENMVVTVEPGIYLPEWGGIRIEDTVLVNGNGCEILTTSSKQLLEI